MSRCEKKVIRHSFRGKRFKVCLDETMKNYGECSSPLAGVREIKIRRGQSSRAELDSIIHESLHASFWAKDESIVKQTANDISRLLWKLGYRKGDSLNGHLYKQI